MAMFNSYVKLLEGNRHIMGISWGYIMGNVIDNNGMQWRHTEIE